MNSTQMHARIALFQPRLIARVTPEMVAAQPIDAVEQELDARFPPLYREFALSYAGVAFRRQAFFAVEGDCGNVGNIWAVSTVLGFGGAIPSALARMEFVPDDVLPIIACDGAACVGLGIRGKASGKVFGCSMDLWLGADEWAGTRLAATSFGEFIEHLRFDG